MIQDKAQNPVAPAPADERDKALAREVLNHHYDYPSQKLEFKACLDEFAAVLTAIRAEIWRTAIRAIPTVDQLSRGESITAESFRADAIAALESARTGKVGG